MHFSKAIKQLTIPLSLLLCAANLSPSMALETPNPNQSFETSEITSYKFSQPLSITDAYSAVAEHGIKEGSFYFDNGMIYGAKMIDSLQAAQNYQTKFFEEFGAEPRIVKVDSIKNEIAEQSGKPQYKTEEISPTEPTYLGDYEAKRLPQRLTQVGNLNSQTSDNPPTAELNSQPLNSPQTTPKQLLNANELAMNSAPKSLNWAPELTYSAVENIGTHISFQMNSYFWGAGSISNVEKSFGTEFQINAHNPDAGTGSEPFCRNKGSHYIAESKKFIDFVVAAPKSASPVSEARPYIDYNTLFDKCDIQAYGVGMVYPQVLGDVDNIFLSFSAPKNTDSAPMNKISSSIDLVENLLCTAEPTMSESDCMGLNTAAEPKFQKDRANLSYARKLSGPGYYWVSDYYGLHSAPWSAADCNSDKIVGKPVSGVAPIYADIPTNCPLYETVKTMREKNIILGYSSKEYKPSEFISRGAAAAMFYRSKGSPSYQPPAKSPFTDVNPSTKFYKEILWAQSAGIIKGWDDGTFRPSQTVLNDQFSAFLYRANGSPSVSYKSTSIKPLVDVQPGSVFYKEINWAIDEGLMDLDWPGYDIRPDSFFRSAGITRGNAACVLFANEYYNKRL